MQITKTHKIIISTVAVVLLFGVFVYVDKMRAKKVLAPIDNMATSTTSSDISSVTNIGGLDIKTEGTGSYTIKQVPATEGQPQKQIPVPSLNRPVVFANGVTFTAEVKDIITKNIKELQLKLKNQPTNLELWINLGLYQKMSGDYDGAVLSWKYVGDAADRDFISFGNLGDLYAYYLKNNTLAETYYKKAISNGPTQSYLYVQLAGVYRDVFKDIDKARAIVNQGLLRIPNEPSLLQLKATLL